MWTHSSSDSKKVHDKRTRLYKNKRSLYASVTSNQPKITSYYNYLNAIEKLALENKELRDWLHSMLEDKNQKNQKDQSTKNVNTSKVLQLLMQSPKKMEIPINFPKKLMVFAGIHQSIRFQQICPFFKLFI